MTQLMRTDAREQFIDTALNIPQCGCVFDENAFREINAVYGHFLEVINMKGVCSERSKGAQLQQVNPFRGRAVVRPFFRLVHLLLSNGLDVKMQPRLCPDKIDFCQDSIEVGLCKGCLNQW